MRALFALRLPTRIALVAVLVATLTGCAAERETLPPPDYAAARATWDSLRAERDALFRSESSPLLDDARATFDGLRYFPFDSSLVFRVRVSPSLERDTILMTTSTGEARPLVPYGILRFERNGRAHTLTAFEPLGPGPRGRLFIPFQDGTSGTTTYGGGRYLDIEETADGVYTLDLNQAYHPYCVYNPIYSCPIPPSENRLGLAVTAGERLPENSGA